MRIYLPATAADLPNAATNPSVLFSATPRARLGHAVTPQLHTAHPELDQDELEWLAFQAAAADAAELLRDSPNVPPMRVVLSLEVSFSSISEVSRFDAGQASLVKVDPEPKVELAAVHVDEPESAALIRKFRADPEPEILQPEVLDADLLWYDPSEIPAIPIPQ